MKKTYSNPTIEVVKIQTVGMLAESFGQGEFGGQTGGTSGGGITVNGRDFDFDDEDEY